MKFGYSCSKLLIMTIVLLSISINTNLKMLRSKSHRKKVIPDGIAHVLKKKDKNDSDGDKKFKKTDEDDSNVDLTDDEDQPIQRPKINSFAIKVKKFDSEGFAIFVADDGEILDDVNSALVVHDFETKMMPKYRSGEVIKKVNDRKNQIKFNENIEENCDNRYGYGFDGVVLKELVDLKNPHHENTNTVNKLISPFIGSISDKYSKFKLAYGDFDESVINAENGQLDLFACKGMPLKSGEKYGVLAYSGKFDCIPDEEESELKICSIFQNCGTIAITLDKDSLPCFAKSSKLGEAMEKASKDLSNLSFGISIPGKFTKTIKIGRILKDEVKDEDYDHNGNFFFTVKGKLPEIDFKIAENKINDILVIEDSEIHLSIKASKDNVLYIADKIEKKEALISEDIPKIGEEFIISLKGDITINLDKLTNGFLPNLKLKVNSFDCLLYKGGPEKDSDMSPGLYATINYETVTHLLLESDFSEEDFPRILDYIRFGLGGKKQNDQNNNEFTKGYIQITENEIGFRLIGQTEFKCLLVYGKSFRVSCEFDKVIFTAFMVLQHKIKKWVIEKTEKLFENGKKRILEFKEGIKEFASNALDALNELGRMRNNWLMKKKFKKFKK